MPNIWAIDDDAHKNDTVNSSHSNSESFDDSNSTVSQPVVASNLDDDLEKPSFLRRLAKRRAAAIDKPSDDDPSNDRSTL